MKSLNFINLFIAFALVSFVKGDFIRSCKEKKTIALTFDDGPHFYTEEFVNYLIDEGIKATFFVVGKFHYPHGYNTPEYQKAMKKAHDHGIQIASHTFEHKISSDMSEFKESLDKNDDFIEGAIGERPRYFRAPKGHCYEDCKASLIEWDYPLIQWDVDTSDWDLETSGSAKQRVKDSIKILKENFAEERDNYLILMHETQEYTVREIVPWILHESGMAEKGYRFVTVAECLGDKDGMYRHSSSHKSTGNVSKVRGRCGSNYGSCANSNECCSEYGYCGTSSDYCSTGCQSEYGRCNKTTKKTTTTKKSTKTTKKGAISTVTGRCGSKFGGACSKSDQCCSKYGYCGTSSEYCGSGCQSEYGYCSSTSNNKSKTTGKVATSTVTGKCGSKYGACSHSNQCCSKYGYCGTSSEYCGSGCQSKYGICK